MESHYPPEHPTAGPITAQVVGPPPRRKSHFFSRLLWVFLTLGLGGSLLANVLLMGALGIGAADSDGRLQEKHYSHEHGAADKVAIISVEGAILDADGFVKRQVDRALKDDHVKAVVLRVDSPGGTVTASDFLYHHLQKLRTERDIPIVVSMGGIAASGGYYVAMAVGDQTDSIFAEPSTWTGSIGVVIPHYNLAELLGNWGVKEDSIASHRLKTMGSFAKPMSEEERTILQGLVDDSFTRFKEVVRSGRPKFRQDPAALAKLATGQVFTAEQAKSNGLVDAIGFLDKAVERAIEIAGLDAEHVEVVKYKREATLAGLLLGGEAQAHRNDLSTIVEMATPRAYFLFSWLPVVK
jgi:protease IV